MAHNRTRSEATPLATAPARPDEVAPPPEVADMLAKVDRLLQDGRPEKALEEAARSGVNSPWATNALGVCQLRLGNAEMAVNVFRSLVLAAGGVILRPEVPAAFKVNFAAALLAAGNLSGGLSVLDEVRDEANPSVQRLRAALKRWKGGLTLWQRLNWYLGGDPGVPLVLDFPLGDLA